MKKTRWFDTLSNSTKATVTVCGSLVAATAAVMLILMFHPIQKEDQPTIVVEPVRHTEYSTTTHETTTTAETTRPKPQTLSTWNAGVNGYSRSLDEFMNTTTTDPRLRRSDTTPYTTTTGLTRSTTVTEEGISTTTAAWDDEDNGDDTPTLSTAGTERPQTVTTTVIETAPPATEPEPVMTAPPLPVEVDTPAPDVME